MTVATNAPAVGATAPGVVTGGEHRPVRRGRSLELSGVMTPCGVGEVAASGAGGPSQGGAACERPQLHILNTGGSDGYHD